MIQCQEEIPTLPSLAFNNLPPLHPISSHHPRPGKMDFTDPTHSDHGVTDGLDMDMHDFGEGVGLDMRDFTNHEVDDALQQGDNDPSKHLGTLLLSCLDSRCNRLVY